MQGFKFGLTLITALLLSGSTGLLRPQAASRLTEDLTALVKLAEAVAEVEVLNQEVLTDPTLGMTLTRVRAKITKVYKGQIADPAVTLETFGGAAEVVPGQAIFRDGERTVLLLAKSPREANCWRVLGGEAGQIRMQTDDAGKAFAVRASGIFDYFKSDKSSLTGYENVRAQRVSADEADSILKAIVNTGRPVLGNAAPAAPAALSADVSIASMPVESTSAAGPWSVLSRLLAILTVMTIAFLICRKIAL